MTTLANLTTYISGESQSFLTAVEKTRGGLRSLISSLDPVAAATARYNRQVDMLDRGLQQNKITLEQHASLTQRLTARYQEQIRGQTAVTTSAGSMRAGMQQLSFQLGDVATQFASGTKPMIIFAQQGGQVIQALQLMTNSTKGFLGFLSGPWGQLLTAGAIVLSSLTAKLFENADAAEAAKLANDGLSDAQSALGKMFDLNSGKLEHQNELLRLNARLTAINLRSEADKQGRSARETFAVAGQASYLGLGSALSGRFGGEVGAAQQQIMAAIAARRMTAEQAIAATEKIDFTGLKVSREQFQKAIIDATSAGYKRQTAEAIERSLTSGQLDPSLRQDGRQKKPPKDRSDQREERFDDQMARLRDEQLGLRLGITSDIRLQANIQRDQVTAELEAYKIDLQHQVAQKEITAERAKELLKVKERNSELEMTRINWRLDDQITRDELEARRDALNAAGERLRFELDGARTQEERRRIQLQILDNDQEMQRASLEAVKATHATTDAEYQLAEARLARLDADRDRGRAAIERNTLGPLADYLDRLPKSAADLNEAYERLAADGLGSVSDGLADVITGAKTMGQVFSNVARQIVNDLARIAVQKYVTAPLANLLGLGGGGGGFPSGLSSAITDAGRIGSISLPSLDLPHFASGGSLRIGGLPGVDRNLLSINGVPAAMVSRGEMIVAPSNDNSRAPTVHQTIQFSGAVDIADRAYVNQMALAAKHGAVQAIREERRRGG